MAARQQMRAQQGQSEAVADNAIENRYQQVVDAADTAYDTVADTVESFFSGVIDQGSGILQEGWIDVEVIDGQPTARYRGRLGGKGKHDSIHRYAPLSDWDEYVQDVYAPLAAAAAALDQEQDNASAGSQIAAIDTDIHDDPDAEAAQALYEDVAAAAPVEDVHVRQPVYPASYAEES